MSDYEDFLDGFVEYLKKNAIVSVVPASVCPYMALDFVQMESAQCGDLLELSPEDQNYESYLEFDLYRIPNNLKQIILFHGDAYKYEGHGKYTGYMCHLYYLKYCGKVVIVRCPRNNDSYHYRKMYVGFRKCDLSNGLMMHILLKFHAHLKQMGTL
jgi:hypothetical protein